MISSKKNCTPLLIAAFVYLAFSRAVFAVGVGAADIRSNLGEQLLVSIPVFNISNPESLVLNVESDMFSGTPNQRLSARLDRSNSQLSVVVSTDWAVMEPYVEFSLTLQDGSVQHAKDFIVLLEFTPISGRADPLRVDSATVAQQNNESSSPLSEPVIRLEESDPRVNSQPVAATYDGASSATDGSTMGPYDWAQKGQVPATFGAVLDGQSLWRVARRINQAMDVSVEQMMVALYEANPSAFYSSSTDSLKAGSTLTIPNQSVVRQYSEVAAQARLDALSNDSATPVVPVDDLVAGQSDVISPAIEETEGSELAALEDTSAAEDIQTESNTIDNSNAQPPLFVIGDSQTVLQQQPQDSAIGGLPNDNAGDESQGGDASRRQDIIDSLSQTIGDLMRDNVDKEQRLVSMEARLKSLESTLDSVGLADDGVSTSVLPEQSSAETKWWLWLLPIFAGLGFWLFFRARNDLRSPEPELFDDRQHDEIEPNSIHVKGEEFEQQGFEEYDSSTDFSGFRSNRSQNPEAQSSEEEVEGVTYLEINDAEIAVQVTEEPKSDVIEFDTSKIASFPGGSEQALKEAINTFIQNRDFGAARDVLDAARGKELDEPNYHFQRLRILLEKDDEHGFYEYFNMVEAKFQDVDRSLQMDLANLVSRLNQN